MTMLGIIAPLPSEARCLSGARHRTGEQVELEGNVLVGLSGVGPERARAASERLVERGARALVSFGCAGGLDPAVAVGELLLPQAVLDADGRSFDTEAAWRAALASRLGLVPRAGTMVESPRVLKTAEQKAAAYRATGALAVDMESASVAAVARASGVPFLAVRVVCDSATMSIPRATLLAVDAEGRLRIGPLLGALLRRPRELVAIVRMDLGFRAAQRGLRGVRRRAGTRLAWEPEATQSKDLRAQSG